jgi:hypothetical protein
MNLGAMLITQKFDLQTFTISCQYVKIPKYTYMLWIS